MDEKSLILVVDDEPAGRQVIESVLFRDYQLEFAAHGPEALAKAALRPPDLVLLDIMMPGMDGFEVCRRLRAHPHTAEVPIVMLTALDDSGSRLEALRAGADDFLTKPVDRLETVARVKTITRLYRYRREFAAPRANLTAASPL